MLKNNWKNFQQLALVLCVWRVILFCVAALAPFFLPYKPSFPYADTLLPKYHLPQWLFSWANFDGVHYLTIVEKGYFGTGLIQAFFPLYPILVKIFTFVFFNTIISGLVISNLAFFLAVCVLFLLLQKTFSKKIAWWSILFFLLFPTSFFMASLYGESTFILLVVSSFYFAKKQQWLLAGICAGLASATRVVGIFLFPALLIELLASKNPQQLENLGQALLSLQFQTFFTKASQLVKELFTTNLRETLYISLSCTGLLAYMLYLFVVFHDPLYFFHVQREFGSGREDHLVLLPQVLWRGFKILVTTPFDLRWWSYFQEFFFTISALLLCFVGFFKRFKIPLSWLFFSFLAILLPTTTGTLSSMPRYVLVAFPIFVILAQLSEKQRAWRIVLVVSFIALFLNTILFIQGYWVA